MPIYKIVEVGSGGGGGSCLGTLFALVIGMVLLSYACDSLTSQNSGGVAVSDRPTSSNSDQTTSQPESVPDPEPESGSRNTSEPNPPEPDAPSENEPEQTLRQRFINDWALRRFKEEERPVAPVAIAGARSFGTRLARELRDSGVNAQSGVLKTTAYESQAFLRRLGGGDRQVLRRLGLTQLTGHLMVGRLSIREPDPGELHKAHAQLSLNLVPLNGSQPVRSEFKARGGGFDQSDARGQALKRVRKAVLTSPIADQLTRP